MTARVRRRIQWRMITVLTVAWVLFWGDLSLANVLSGVVLGLLVTLVFPLPVIEFEGRLHVLGVLRLIARLLRDLVVSSVTVAAQAFNLRRTMHNSIIRVQLDVRSDLYLAAVTELMSLVPGSIVLEARRQEHVVYLHVMDVRSPADLDKAREDVLSAQERVVKAMGSRAEIEALPGRTT